MSTQTSEEYLKAITQPSLPVDWLKVAEELKENEVWLDKSSKIAFAVLSLLRERHMTKQQLAERMGVKAQYISRIVKGTENLTLETISKLEMALGVSLIEVTDISDSVIAYPTESIFNRKWKTFTSLSEQFDDHNPFITQFCTSNFENAYV